jgi:hypothetical protein
MGTTEASLKIEEADELRTAYNSAFSKWVTEVTLLQAYSADPSATVDRIAMAKDRTQQAERAYRERRNLLLRRMSSRVIGSK